MKKTLSAAVALSVFAVPAYSANMENPLYMPKQGTVYSKTSAGVMYKKADSSQAQKDKGHAGATEFPIWRLHEELGYGITDRLELYGKFGYTHDGDIDRKGMHLGRAGLKYRVLDTDAGFAWDLYADAQLGGISEMSGSYAANGFTYDNYSNGRWGFHVGTQFGKTWSKFTAAAFAEVLRTFGNDNNKIDISGFDIAELGGLPITKLGFPDEISVDLKSTTEFNAGLKTFYQIDDRWSVGGSFTWKRHEDNGVEGLASSLGAVPTDVATGLAMAQLGIADPAVAAQYAPAVGVAAQKQVLDALLDKVADMNDGFDEYIFNVTVANQITDAMQVAVYGEYTFDNGHRQSQNTTDVKAEMGVRLNVRF